MAYNDSAGNADTWTRSLTGPGQVHGVDNQSIAAGPYPNNTKPSTARPGADYPHAMYYCSHEDVNAFCSRSDDGGHTFNPSRPIFPLPDGCGNHGHVKVGADGTVYVPMNNSCEGHEGVSLRSSRRDMALHPGARHVERPLGFVDRHRQRRQDHLLRLRRAGRRPSDDHQGNARQERSRQPDHPLAGAGDRRRRAAGLTNIVFPTVVAGDPGRAAFIFHGTTTEGDSGDMATFPATPSGTSTPRRRSTAAHVGS